MVGNGVVGDVLILGPEGRSAFASLGYGLMTGDVKIEGIAINQIEDLKNAYVESFWGNKW